MKILFIGDIVGAPGRRVVADNIDKIREKYGIDLTIANGENSAHGKGITKKIYDSFLQMHIDVITMGNHTYSKDDIFRFIDEADRLVVPANMDPVSTGKKCVIVDCKGYKIGVYNLIGSVFMDNCNKSPFSTMEELLQKYPSDIHIVDFHGEATSEKITFFRYFQNKVELVVGTHTHVQTADEQVIDGCGYISDVGMCGGYDSVLGRDVDEVLRKTVNGEKTRFTVSESAGIFCGIVADIDIVSGRCKSIERIQIRPKS